MYAFLLRLIRGVENQKLRVSGGSGAECPERHAPAKFSRAIPATANGDTSSDAKSSIETDNISKARGRQQEWLGGVDL